MPTLKSILKNYFSSGKKPAEQHFHEWIDSYVHKTEDGLTISEEGNFGIGTETPNAQLHVNGGLKIGDVEDDDPQVVQGTFRWHGTKFQVFFADEWHVIWEADQSSIRQIVIEPGLTITGSNLGETDLFSFPASAKLLQIILTYSYTLQTSINSARGLIRIQLIESNLPNASHTVVGGFVGGNRGGINTDLTLSIDLTGDVKVEANNTYSLRFALTGIPGTVGGGEFVIKPPTGLSITIKRIELKYQN